jgi:hypothetical protein
MRISVVTSFVSGLLFTATGVAFISPSVFPCKNIRVVFSKDDSSSQQQRRRPPLLLFASQDSVAGRREETEAERLLRRAARLRAEAEQAEKQVRGDLVKKKSDKDALTDRLIGQLFFADGSSSLVDRLRTKRPGMATLEDIVERLDEREVIAQGGDHVEFRQVGDKTEFYRTASKDEKELERLEGLIDQLIEAVSVLDREFLEQKQATGAKSVHHAEEEHWGGGKCAERLRDRISQIRRERSEQFQKRMEEFREAQRRKDDPDHKFKGYTDLGTLN